MKFSGTLVAVKDIEKSKQFYQDILGLKIIEDCGVHVVLTGGVFLQTVDTWKVFIHREEDEIIFNNNAVELYFEENDLDRFISKLQEVKDIDYLHPLIEHPWGQRVVRFYDLDGHIIEVGENIQSVVKRFLDRGLSIKEVAIRMDVSEKYIQSLLKE